MQIVTESLQLLQTTVSSGIDIKTELPETPCLVPVNPAQMHQVIMNLCTNAFQALEHGSGIINICLEISTRTKLPLIPLQSTLTDEVVHLSIHDNGPGIDTSDLQNIFDPFFSTKKVDKGAGLGLSVAQRIIDNHQGLINVDSHIDKGTTFHIYLPKADTDTAERLYAAAEDDRVLPGSGHILLIDDDQDVLESMTEQLQHIGYNVSPFAESIEALAHFRQHSDKFFVVITDQTMPGLSGTELSKQLRTIRSEIPIILYTGYCEQSTEQHGIDYFLQKPVSMVLLSQILLKLTAKETDINDANN